MSRDLMMELERIQDHFMGVVWWSLVLVVGYFLWMGGMNVLGWVDGSGVVSGFLWFCGFGLILVGGYVGFLVWKLEVGLGGIEGLDLIKVRQLGGGLVEFLYFLVGLLVWVGLGMLFYQAGLFSWLGSWFFWVLGLGYVVWWILGLVLLRLLGFGIWLGLLLGVPLVQLVLVVVLVGRGISLLSLHVERWRRSTDFSHRLEDRMSLRELEGVYRRYWSLLSWGVFFLAFVGLGSFWMYFSLPPRWWKAFLNLGNVVGGVCFLLALVDGLVLRVGLGGRFLFRYVLFFLFLPGFSLKLALDFQSFRRVFYGVDRGKGRVVSIFVGEGDGDGRLVVDVSLAWRLELILVGIFSTVGFLWVLLSFGVQRGWIGGRSWVYFWVYFGVLCLCGLVYLWRGEWRGVCGGGWRFFFLFFPLFNFLYFGFLLRGLSFILERVWGSFAGLLRPRGGVGVLLEARDLVKNYYTPANVVEVLRGVDLAIYADEIVSIVGKSGVGKSTLLNLLGLLDTPTAGQIYIRSRPVGDLNARDYCILRNRHIGFVFQFYHLLGDFSALENTMMAGMIGGGVFRWHFYGSKYIYRERALRLLDMVGLAHRVHHYPYQLSGGERQRVAIARALINDPDIVLLDEPTGNLDDRTSYEIHQLLWQMQSDLGKTFVVVTHDREIAQKASRCIVMEGGRVREV